jgi:hypothetical protein
MRRIVVPLLAFLVLAVAFLVLPWLVFLVLPAEDQPRPETSLGGEAADVTGPLDEEGYIDYQTALNERLGKGITPEKNANVLLQKALGPERVGQKMPPEFFKWLGIEALPERGDYFITMDAYLRNHALLNNDERAAVWNQETWAHQHPWTAQDYPHLAGWLKANEKPLALVVEAMKRPEYFNPLVARKTQQELPSLIGATVTSGQFRCRELASALAARAMLRTAAWQFDEAWEDLLACHRLGRLVARGATFMDSLVGVAIDQIASNADVVWLYWSGPSPERARKCLRDLQGLPPLPPAADKIDLGERFIYLDNVQLLARGEGVILAMVVHPLEIPPKKPDAKVVERLKEINWGPAADYGHRWHSRLAAVLRKERAEREKELAEIEAEFNARQAEADKILVEILHEKKLAEIVAEFKEQKTEATRRLLGLLQGKAQSDKRVGKAFGDLTMSIGFIRNRQNAIDRTEQTLRNLHVAFALAVYRGEGGRYPARLEELAPKYLAAVPSDLFSGKALVYRPFEGGYLLYSIGVNGKDEGGRRGDDNPPGDDLRVLLPLPDWQPR